MKSALRKTMIHLRERSYLVVVGQTLFSDKKFTIDSFLPSFLKKKALMKRAFLIADKNLGSQIRRVEKKLFDSGWKVTRISIESGESLKSIQSIWSLYGELLHSGANRHSVLFAVGGGSVGDAVGFVAGTFMRGIPWVNIPTTLLAQVDSGIGGKTGINHESGKNLVGLIYQPSLVICDLQFLKTLPKRELISGLGEVIKVALISDSKFLSQLEKILKKNAGFSGPFDPDILEKFIFICIRYKASLVEKDEFDRKGVREILNFGHTFGHALEKIAGYGELRHGEAVLWGMRIELALSAIRGHLNPEIQLELDSLLSQITLPELPSNLSHSKIIHALGFDKKRIQDHHGKKRVRFVLLKRVGKCVLDSEVTDQEIRKALQLVGVRK